MAGHLGDYLAELYLQYFSNRRPEYAAYMGGAARLVLERLGNSDALYHNVEHTMMPGRPADHPWPPALRGADAR
jgi:hypothetical protein